VNDDRASPNRADRYDGFLQTIFGLAAQAPYDSRSHDIEEIHVSFLWNQAENRLGRLCSRGDGKRDAIGEDDLALPLFFRAHLRSLSRSLLGQTVRVAFSPTPLPPRSIYPPFRPAV